MTAIAPTRQLVLIGAAVLAGLLLRAEPALAQSPSPGAAPGRLTGMWEARWKTEVKSYQVAEDVIGLKKGDRQLEHDGTLNARFNFCADRTGTIHGAGTLKVTKNGSARLFKPAEERPGGELSNEMTCDKTFSPTALADVPLTVIGQVRDSDVWLFLNSDMVDYNHVNSCFERDPWFGRDSSHVGGRPLKFPAVGLMFAAGSTALTRGISLPARDGEPRRIETSVQDPGGWMPRFDTLTLERTEVQIRRDPLAGLPTLFEDLFEVDLAQLRTAASAQLERILPFFKCDVTAAVTVMLKGGGDPIFLEVMGDAREAALRAWFAGHGIGASRITWRKRIGDGDRTEFVFK